MNTSDHEIYKTEVENRWGHTCAHQEYQKKTAGYTKENWQTAAEGLHAVVARFAQCKRDAIAADSAHVQTLVKELQDYITENYYTCTNEILSCLGQMYVGEQGFRESMDQHYPGTAEFVSQAIKIYLNGE